MGSHQETERISQHEVRGQGDIIRIEWPEGMSEPQLGVVINADCDLAHGKTDGVVAFVPIYTFSDYLARFWAAGHLEEVTSNSTQAVLKLAGDTDGAALHAWLKASTPESIAAALGKHKSLKRGQAEQLQSELRKLSLCLDSEQTSVARFAALCRVAPNPQSYARTHIAGAKKAMGEGHFFISDLVDHPSVGFVVRMRRIYTLPEQDYFVSTSAQRSGSDGVRPTAVRIARLTALYQFKVLQLFSLQYSRIGLPDEISALSALAIDDLVTTFTGVTP